MRKAAEAKTDMGSERTCIVTRTKGEPETMIRFVVGPNGQVVPDLKHKLPGRGVWVTAQADKVAEAVKRKAFARGFRTEVVVSAALPAEIEDLLITDCLQSFALANKAGQVVTGFAKVEAAIAKGGVAGLVEATDAGADGGRKLAQAMLRCFGRPAAKPQVKLFTSLQLSLALGHTNVIHAALIDGAAAQAFLSRCRRLELYRSAPSGAGGATDEKAAPEFV
ncbi:RNA-binding protein [Methylovirgula sp. HY1]|uniref:RNA-binding protein n=1 Tax=Methylovirgula sp. HY1 TaxID=2822761 RepID=UPI0021053E55|nr:RNA-binding protein [Methylovirgula sp. HY1]